MSWATADLDVVPAEIVSEDDMIPDNMSIMWSLINLFDMPPPRDSIIL